MVRTFGVEEELLLVDARSRQPLAASEDAVQRAQRPDAGEPAPAAAPLDADGAGEAQPGGPGPKVATAPGGHALTLELQQEQIEVVGPPQTSLADQIAAIRTGRTLADAAARAVGGRAVAIGTSVSAGLPHLVPEARYRRIQRHVGILAAEQLTCGFHVHVAVDDREQGVAALDRIRVWLPVLLALSANSPFWYGVESGFASYRYQAWTRWPTAGAYEIFGSAEAYDRCMAAVLRSGVALDDGMLYYDARLSVPWPTIEVRVADVVLDPVQAGVIAAMIRALVETACRQHRDGVPPHPAGVTELRAWSWRASRFGVEEKLVSPSTGRPTPAGHVVAELLDLLRPVLDEYGEDAQVQAVVAEILQDGPGAQRQREAFARRHDLTDVVDTAISLGTPAPDGVGA
ncbi:glutamate--cysteine ligase [Puerhibacterium puerhi]|uniref:glutamate--cysteine ligase n=1 Tax=Puerhibacterium puerhi TaxID=2692623 RepID=UPI00135959A8|nr:glutamate--cysteine ligase [Puerhibacterium puerhi]